MKKSLRFIFLLVLGAAFLIGAFQPVYSQETEEDEFMLEDVIVTATKREQALQDVPVAITVIGQEQMERQQIYTLQDLSRVTAGLEFGDTGGAPGGAAIIRGIGTTGLSGIQMEPSVGIVVDGVPQGRVNVGNIFDLERVEVLRGPQGTLFGNTASAGVINIITAAPDTTKFMGKFGVDATFDGKLGSEFGRQEGRLMLNLPINENSAVRFTANGYFTQGIKKNKWPGMDDEESKNYDFRVRYLYEPRDDFSINLIADYASRRMDGPNLFTMTYLRSTPDPDQLPDKDFPLLTDYFADTCGFTASTQNQDVCTDFMMFDREKRHGLSAQIDWVMGNHSFYSLTSFKEETFGPYNQNIFGYGHPKLNTIPEFVGVSLPFLPPGVLLYPGQQYFLDIRREIGTENVSKILVQEFRISSPKDQKFDYIGGLYFTQTKSQPEGPLGITESWYPAPPPFVTQGEITSPSSRGSYKRANIAAFADGNYPITDALKIMGGLRFSRYSLDSYTQDLDPASPGYGVTRLNQSYDEDFLTFRVGAQYNVTPDTMIYATISSAVKAPVVLREDPMDPTSEYIVMPGEEPTSYEVGTKIRAFDGKLALDISAFHNAIKNYQGEACSYDDVTDNLMCPPTTIDELESEGFEVDILARPIQGMVINAGYIYNPVEYPPGFADELTGEQIANASVHKFTFSGEYGRSVTKNLYGFFSMDAVYKTERRLNTMWYPSSIYPACWVFGARIGISEIANEKWSLTLFGRNLFEEPEPVAIFQAYHDQMHMSITKENSYRQVGISFNMNF